MLRTHPAVLSAVGILVDLVWDLLPLHSAG
jgi:hypothetical protein